MLGLPWLLVIEENEEVGSAIGDGICCYTLYRPYYYPTPWTPKARRKKKRRSKLNLEVNILRRRVTRRAFLGSCRPHGTVPEPPSSTLSFGRDCGRGLPQVERLALNRGPRNRCERQSLDEDSDSFWSTRGTTPMRGCSHGYAAETNRPWPLVMQPHDWRPIGDVEMQQACRDQRQAQLHRCPTRTDGEQWAHWHTGSQRVAAMKVKDDRECRKWERASSESWQVLGE
jgi:hypothetical protein